MGKQSAFAVACLNFRERFVVCLFLTTVPIWRSRFVQMCLLIASIHMSAFFFRKLLFKKKVD